MALDLSEIISITVDDHYRSVFTTTAFPLEARGDMWISEQQDVVNFRYRASPSGYESDWHVAGDPTLIIVNTGCIELELRDGSTRQFRAGDAFIAEDYLPSSLSFDSALHGHRARVTSKEALSAIHFKLAKRGEG